MQKQFDGWCKCAVCGHKLFRVVDGKSRVFEVDSSQFVDWMPKHDGNAVEIKCHSCKTINRVQFE